MKTARALVAALLLYVAGGSAQQQVPFDKTYNIPVAPTGIPHIPLPKKPVVYDTAEGMRIRAVVVAHGLTYPWSIAFLPDGRMLVTERTGKLRVIRNGVLDPKPVAGVPTSVYAGVSGLPGAVHGLMDIALHPKFQENRYIYFTYTKPLPGDKSTTALARGQWNGTSLDNVKDLFVADGGSAAIQSGSRIAFGRDGMLFMTVSGGAAQDPASHGGKVLRLNDDGTAPKDNPFVGRAGYKPEIYTLGHRNLLGLAVHPTTGAVFQNENGPNGGDEINLILPGRNYGWPAVTLGRTYQGPFESGTITHAGYEQPLVYWMPAIAVSGMTFYTGNKLPKWKGDIFVGSLRFGEVPGTGHLERILFDQKMEELRREWLLADLRQRIRDIRQGPDELLYVLTDDADGAVIRIEPAP